jgi:hypothetical protein
MKKPILTLPCKYSITDFTKQAHGYHCQNCDKELHDFRNASNSEINSKIKNSERSVCGIFNQSQVAAKTSMLNLPLWNSRVSLSLLGILGFLGPIVSSCSTEVKPIQEKKQQAFNVLKFPMRLRGSVCDHVTRKIIPNAEIKIIQNGKIIRVEKTDENGFFDFFLLKSELSNETFDLVFKSTDFVADTLERFSFEEAKTKQIQLSLQATVIEKTDVVTMTVGDVVCEPLQGIVAPEPVLSGVPMEVAEPEMPIEIGKVQVSEPVKEVAPTTENTDKQKRRRKKN